MKPSAIRIERMLEKIEARLVPPPRKVLQVIIDDGDDEAEVKEKKEKALAEHIAAHSEDAGLTVADIDWIVREIVLQPQELIEDGYTAKDAAEDTDKDAAVSETPDVNVLSTPDATASSKPWRPVHQRPAPDQRRPTWKKWSGNGGNGNGHGG